MDRIAEGTDSDAVRRRLASLESDLKTEQGAVAALVAATKTPIRLPSVEDAMRAATDLETVLASDPVRAREALRGLLRDGQIVLHPPEDGIYEARAEVLPVVLLKNAEAPGQGWRGGVVQRWLRGQALNLRLRVTSQSG